MNEEKDVQSNEFSIFWFLNDEFEIIDQSLFADYDMFVTCVGDLFSDELNDKIDKDNYKNHFVKYEVEYNDGDEKHNFAFYYLDLNP